MYSEIVRETFVCARVHNAFVTFPHIGSLNLTSGDSVSLKCISVVVVVAKSW